MLIANPDWRRQRVTGSGWREWRILGIISGAAPSGVWAGPVRPSQPSPYARAELEEVRKCRQLFSIS